MKTEMELWAVKLGAALLVAAFLFLTPALLPLGGAETAAAQGEGTESEATPAPYAALQACEVGMALSAGEGCHVSGTGTSFVVGRGSGCIVLYDPAPLAICHAAATDSSSVLSARRGEEGSWTIEEISAAPGSCGELTGLHEAVRLGNAQWVACLAAAGAGVNARDEKGDTPLHIAVAKGSVELTQTLIAAGADVSLLSHKERPVPIGLTELNQIFASAGSKATLQGAEIVAKAGQGATPLQTAVENGDMELVPILVVAGMATPEPVADSDAKAEPEVKATPAPTPEPTKSNTALSQPGWMDGTLLHDAIEEEDEELVRMLVEAGADVDVPGWMDETPLHAAIEKGNVEIVRTLVEAGADVNKPGWMGQTPLALAVEEGNADILEILISATPASTGDNTALSQPGWMEETLLHDAIEEEDEDLVRMLVEAGADVDMPGWMDETPLHAAIEKGNVEIVRILVEAGADVNKPGWMGQTPLALAVEEGNAEVLAILLSATTGDGTEEQPSTEDGDKVVTGYDEMIRLQPDNIPAYFLRGASHFTFERYEMAIADFDEVIRLQPDNAPAYFLRGSAHLLLEHFEQAIADLDEAIRLEPDNVQAYSIRGSAHLLFERYEEAIADFDETIRLQPDNAEIYLLRGLAHFGLERPEKAVADLATALTLAEAAGNDDLIADIEEALGEAVGQ